MTIIHGVFLKNHDILVHCFCRRVFDFSKLSNIYCNYDVLIESYVQRIFESSTKSAHDRCDGVNRLHASGICLSEIGLEKIVVRI